MITEVFTKLAGWDAVLLWAGTIIFAAFMIYLLVCAVFIIAPAVVDWAVRTGERIIDVCGEIEDDAEQQNKGAL